MNVVGINVLGTHRPPPLIELNFVYTERPSNLWWCKFTHSLTLSHCYTPNANMADHSVVARNELHESEVSQSLCFVLIMLPQRSLASWSICSVLFRCAYELLCFWMRRERIEIFHRSPQRENSGSMQFVETTKRSSRSPRELKFVWYVSG